MCGGGDDKSPPCAVYASGRYFVAIRWGTICVVGVYAPPSLGMAHFEAVLGDVEDVVRRNLPGPVVVAGDFNSKSLSWG